MRELFFSAVRVWGFISRHPSVPTFTQGLLRAFPQRSGLYSIPTVTTFKIKKVGIGAMRLLPRLAALITPKACMESAVRRYGIAHLVSAWNHHGVMHGIKSEGIRRIQPAADAIRGRAAMPCNSQSELIPYQALRSWIKTKTAQKAVFFFGGGSVTKIEP